MNNHEIIILAIALITICFCGLSVMGIYFIRQRKMQIWLPEYINQKLAAILKNKRPAGTRHILFCFVDHYEPGWNKADLELQGRRVDGWAQRYPVMANQFADCDGFHPRHTWFYPPHYFREEHIEKLLTLCRQGFGEIEMHLHHSRMEPYPDTSQTLKQKIIDCKMLYSRYGIFKSAHSEEDFLTYGFIHGDWALDNSRPDYCGVNNELQILKETGCYADFTFPSYMVESQPQMVNTIYYANDDPDKPKSYNRGSRVRTNGSANSGLMIIQGPMGLRWKSRKRWWLPNIDDGEISVTNPPSPARVDFWIDTGIHVAGKPEWIIVKVFTHGAACREHQTLLGEPIEEMHQYLNKKYNDKYNYRLHYVTARELYNIIKAAESGKDGNPNLFRDYLIQPYRYQKNCGKESS